MGNILNQDLPITKKLNTETVNQTTDVQLQESGLRAKDVLKPSEIQAILRIGRNGVYDLLKSSDCPFPVLKIRNKIRVPSKKFFAYIDGLNCGLNRCG